MSSSFWVLDYTGQLAIAMDHCRTLSIHPLVSPNPPAWTHQLVAFMDDGEEHIIRNDTLDECKVLLRDLAARMNAHGERRL